MRITLDVLRDVVRDPERAAAVAKVLGAYRRRIARQEGPDMAADWLDNDVVGFWSPSYRNALNRAGRRIFDTVGDEISDALTAGADVDALVAFLSRAPRNEFDAFAAEALAGRQPRETVYSLGLRPGLAGYLMKKKKKKQTGGANTDAALAAYARGLSSKRRVEALAAILATCSDSRDLARSVHAATGVDPKAFDYGPDTVDAPYLARIVRHLLLAPMASVRAVAAESAAREEKKKNKKPRIKRHGSGAPHAATVVRVREALAQ